MIHLKPSENIPLAREAVVEYLNDAVIVLNQDHIVVDSNRATLSIFGKEKSDVINLRVEEMLKDHPTILEIINQFFTQSTVNDLVEETTLDNGVALEVHVSHLSASGEGVSGCMMILRDVTSQKQAELESAHRLDEIIMLRSIDERMTETLDVNEVMRIGLDGAIKITDADAGFIGLVTDDKLQIAQVGGKYPADLIGDFVNLWDGISGRVASTLKAELIKDVGHDPDYVVDLESTQAEIAIPLLVRERLIGSLILEADEPDKFDIDEFEFARSLGRRIAIALENARLYTQSQQQLAELQALNARLRDMEAQKTDLIRIAAHDLSNPVSTMMGFLDLFTIDRDRLADDHKVFIDTMVEQANRMDTIIHDILSVERVKEGSVRESINLTNLSEQAVQQYETDAAGKNLDYQLIKPDTNIIVFGDVAQLREAIRNLITNAIKYTEKGAVTVKVEQKGDKAVFTVKDTGYGIPDEEQHQVFQPFSRARIPGAEFIKGTGLGLHLVKSIVERHQGQMIFQSTFGVGSTFGFELPLHIE